jgi:hypothetical protein
VNLINRFMFARNIIAEANLWTIYFEFESGLVLMKQVISSAITYRTCSACTKFIFGHLITFVSKPDRHACNLLGLRRDGTLCCVLRAITVSG